jgi:hypothetical protein
MARFKPGDVVIIAHGRSSARWVIVNEDTNMTPVRDPEPAYKVRQAGTHCSARERFVYESELAPVPRDLLR